MTKMLNDSSGDAPDWVISKSTIHEVRFCETFLQVHPLRCINDRFYDIDGAVPENKIKAEITGMLTRFYATQIPQKVRNLLETLRMVCYSKPFSMNQDEIHLLNGVFKTDGTWTPGKQYCINRLRIAFHPEIQDQPRQFLSFLSQLLEPEDILTLQEYLGYCLIPSTKAQAMLFLIGNGGEGKSRIGCVLRDIFGDAMLEAKFQRVATGRSFSYNPAQILFFR